MLYTKDLYTLKIKHYSNANQYTLYRTKSNSNNSNNSRIFSNSSNSISSSRSRSCSLIKELALSNNFDYFFTLTLKGFSFRNDVIKSADFINSSIKHYARLAKQRGATFRYMYVFEKQKKGGIHIHGYFSRFLRFV